MTVSEVVKVAVVVAARVGATVGVALVERLQAASINIKTSMKPAVRGS